MVHTLERRVVAEGVETVEQLEALAMLGCDVAQGYLIGRPITENQMLNILAPTAKAVMMR